MWRLVARTALSLEMSVMRMALALEKLVVRVARSMEMLVGKADLLSGGQPVRMPPTLDMPVEIALEVPARERAQQRAPEQERVPEKVAAKQMPLEAAAAMFATIAGLPASAACAEATIPMCFMGEILRRMPCASMNSSGRWARWSSGARL